MDTLLSAAAAAVVATAVCLVLKRSNSEMTVPLSIAVCAAALGLAFGLLRPVLELMARAKKLSGLTDAVFYPVLKCVGIGFVSRLASDLCRDGGQSAMAGTVELVGAVCALYVSLPLISTFLDMLLELI